MKYACRIYFLVVMAMIINSVLYAHWHYIPFDEAMRCNTFPHAITKTKEIIGIEGNSLYSFFKNRYEQLCMLMNMSSTTLKIPKIIHQIWLGSPVPEVFTSLTQSWLVHHAGRDWYYKLWTDEDVQKMELYNQELYDATDNYGVKSDILRFEILYRYGGVYVDMDYECLAPLDTLHYTYDLYTALQPLDTFFVQLGSALIGAKPFHPLIKQCIEQIKNNWHEKGAPKKTGPVYFTKMFFKYAHQDTIDIAFPAFYFYPFGSTDTAVEKKMWQEKGAFAVHWWAKSWMPKKFRTSLFKTIDNESSVEQWNS